MGDFQVGSTVRWRYTDEGEWKEGILISETTDKVVIVMGAEVVSLSLDMIEIEIVT